MKDRMHKEARPALESLLLGLNRDQLQALLLKLAEQTPFLMATIERQIALLPTPSFQPTTLSPMAPSKPAIPVDTKAIRRQVRSSIHSLDRLHILERRGRFQEYLYLAEAEGHTREICHHAGAPGVRRRSYLLWAALPGNH
jgi:hypothetical protein